MAQEACQSPENRDENDELIHLEFSPPESRYESVGLFQNEKGQQFLIRVNGADKVAVERYTKDLRIHFEVFPDESMQPRQKENSVHQGETEQLLLAEETNLQEQPSQQTTRNLEIAVEVSQSQGIERPHLLKFSVDHSMDRDIADTLALKIPPHSYPFSDATEARVTIIARKGTLSANLFKISQSRRIGVDNATVAAPHQATLTHRVDRKTDFLFTVDGVDDSNSYRLKGDVTVN